MNFPAISLGFAAAEGLSSFTGGHLRFDNNVFMSPLQKQA